MTEVQSYFDIEAELNTQRDPFRTKEESKRYSIAFKKLEKLGGNLGINLPKMLKSFQEILKNLPEASKASLDQETQSSELAQLFLKILLKKYTGHKIALNDSKTEEFEFQITHKLDDYSLKKLQKDFLNTLEKEQKELRKRNFKDEEKKFIKEMEKEQENLQKSIKKEYESLSKKSFQKEIKDFLSEIKKSGDKANRNLKDKKKTDIKKAEREHKDMIKSIEKSHNSMLKDFDKSHEKMLKNDMKKIHENYLKNFEKNFEKKSKEDNKKYQKYFKGVDEKWEKYQKSVENEYENFLENVQSEYQRYLQIENQNNPSDKDEFLEKSKEEIFSLKNEDFEFLLNSSKNNFLRLENEPLIAQILDFVLKIFYEENESFGDDKQTEFIRFLIEGEEDEEKIQNLKYEVFDSDFKLFSFYFKFIFGIEKLRNLVLKNLKKFFEFKEFRKPVDLTFAICDILLSEFKLNDEISNEKKIEIFSKLGVLLWNNPSITLPNAKITDEKENSEFRLQVGKAILDMLKGEKCGDSVNKEIDYQIRVRFLKKIEEIKKSFIDFEDAVEELETLRGYVKQRGVGNGDENFEKILEIFLSLFENFVNEKCSDEKLEEYKGKLENGGFDDDNFLIFLSDILKELEVFEGDLNKIFEIFGDKIEIKEEGGIEENEDIGEEIVENDQEEEE